MSLTLYNNSLGIRTVRFSYFKDSILEKVIVEIIPLKTSFIKLRMQQQCQSFSKGRLA